MHLSVVIPAYNEEKRISKTLKSIDEYLRKQDKPKIKISVKEGSLLPKDTLTLANQAIELSASGKMSLIDLYKALDYPNPEELAANAWLEVNSPEVLFEKDPRVQKVVQSQQAAQEPQDKPSESISFKDLAPDAKAQMLKKVGIIADPEAIAAYDNLENEKKKVDKVNNTKK